MKSKTPKQRVKAEERRLRSLEYFQKNKQLFDRERLMRQLRDARMEATQIEDYLRKLNPAYRQAAQGYEVRVGQIDQMLKEGLPFRGRGKINDLIAIAPEGSYDLLRRVVK